MYSSSSIVKYIQLHTVVWRVCTPFRPRYVQLYRGTMSTEHGIRWHTIQHESVVQYHISIRPLLPVIDIFACTKDK